MFETFLDKKCLEDYKENHLCVRAVSVKVATMYLYLQQVKMKNTDATQPDRTQSLWKMYFGCKYT